MISYFVKGLPTPQGSSRAFVVGGRAVITSANPNLKDWRHLIADASQEQAMMIEGPIKLGVGFVLPRPKSLPKRQMWHIKRPDLDKLIRAVCDALTGIMWHDDSQVVTIEATKSYAANGSHTGVLIEIASLS